MVSNNLNFKYYNNIKYYNKLYHLFLLKIIGRILKKGNKIFAINFLFKLKYLLKKNINNDSNFVLFISLLKALFKFYFIRLRLGSVIKELPIPLSINRQVKIAVKTFLKYSKIKKSRSVNLKALNNIILLTSRRKSIIIRKNNRNYRKALDNRSFLYLIRK
jgi:ribosomal protein S7